jgi:hypothetical protein
MTAGAEPVSCSRRRPPSWFSAASRQPWPAPNVSRSVQGTPHGFAADVNVVLPRQHLGEDGARPALSKVSKVLGSRVLQPILDGGQPVPIGWRARRASRQGSGKQSAACPEPANCFTCRLVWQGSDHPLPTIRDNLRKKLRDLSGWSPHDSVNRVKAMHKAASPMGQPARSAGGKRDRVSSSHGAFAPSVSQPESRESHRFERVRPRCAQPSGWLPRAPPWPGPATGTGLVFF